MFDIPNIISHEGITINMKISGPIFRYALYKFSTPIPTVAFRCVPDNGVSKADSTTNNWDAPYQLHIQLF